MLLYVYASIVRSLSIIPNFSQCCYWSMTEFSGSFQMQNLMAKFTWQNNDIFNEIVNIKILNFFHLKGLLKNSFNNSINGKFFEMKLTYKTDIGSLKLAPFDSVSAFVSASELNLLKKFTILWTWQKGFWKNFLKKVYI